MGKQKIAPGFRSGSLVVVSEAPKKNNRSYWYCRCDCGNEWIVQEGHIKSGHTKSCGCYRKIRMRETASNLSGQRFGRLVALEPTEQRKKDSVVWKCLCDCGKIAFCDSESLARGTTRSCGCLQDEQRKINMEKAIHFVDGTCIEKIACQKENSSNTSGHRGVSRRQNGTWRAELTFQGKRYSLGTYKTFDEAVQARLEGEKTHFQKYLEEYYARQKETSV